MPEITSFADVDDLIDVFVDTYSRGSRDLPDYVSRRMGMAVELRTLRFGICPSNPHDFRVAYSVCQSVPKLANCGGGFVVIGVEGFLNTVVGTVVDKDWLSAFLGRTVDAPLDVVERRIDGVRVLFVRVLGGSSPVANIYGTINFQSPDGNRSQWWLKMETQEPPRKVPPSTVQIIRDLVQECEELTDEEVLAHVGVMTPNNLLTEAGAYLLTAQAGSRIMLNGQSVPGESVFEQFINVEKAVDELNTPVGWTTSGLRVVSRPIPDPLVREALMYSFLVGKYNYIPNVVWEDDTLEIRFEPYKSCHWDLLDFFRAIGYADPRMQGQPVYPINARKMIELGHVSPRFADGIVALYGGEPHWNVVRFMSSVQPPELIEQELVMRTFEEFFERPYMSAESLSAELGIDLPSVKDILSMMECAGAGGAPLLERLHEGWVLGTGARKLLGDHLPYLRSSNCDHLAALKTFLSEYKTVNQSDLALLESIDEDEAECILLDIEVCGHLEESAVPGEYALGTIS